MTGTEKALIPIGIIGIVGVGIYEYYESQNSSSQQTSFTSGQTGYVEATFDNLIVDSTTILDALNGPEGVATGVTFTGINTPISNPIAGMRQIAFVVNNGYTVLGTTVSNTVNDELNQIPTIGSVSIGLTYGGSVPFSISSLVNGLTGQATGANNTTNVALIAGAIIIILIIILALEKNV